MLCQLLFVLLLSVKLELHDIPFVSRDLFVVTDINLFSALADKTHVVGNHNHTTLECVHTSRQSINGLHVQRVCWFVKHNQMRLFVCNDGKYNSSLLTSRELVHHLTLLSSRASKSTEQRSDLFNGLLWHQFLLEKVKRGHRQVKLILKVLSESRNLKMHILFDLSLGWTKFPSHQLNERCFPGSIRANERNPSLQINTEVNLAVELLATWICETDVLNG
mmetsp:Transcript_44163/g.106418  ORF Transcript_44163/g.106418 Transcript_44163/m.106418 type:complete len:220 (+) Transcript_44163:107-766(+)